MRFLSLALLLVVLAAALLGCGGGPKSLQSASECDVPDWYSNTPQDAHYLLAAKTATSQDMQVSLDKATTDARTEIGRQADLRVQGLQKKFDEEVGVANDAQLLQQFTEANKTVVSTSLSGSRIRSQKMCKDGDIWRSYVLVEYPVGAASEAFMQQLQKNDQMLTRVRSSQTFKELDQEVQKFDEWKKQQPPPEPGSEEK